MVAAVDVDARRVGQLVRKEEEEDLDRVLATVGDVPVEEVGCSAREIEAESVRGSVRQRLGFGWQWQRRSPRLQGWQWQRRSPRLRGWQWRYHCLDLARHARRRSRARPKLGRERAWRGVRGGGVRGGRTAMGGGGRPWKAVEGEIWGDGIPVIARGCRRTP